MNLTTKRVSDASRWRAEVEAEIGDHSPFRRNFRPLNERPGDPLRRKHGHRGAVFGPACGGREPVHNRPQILPNRPKRRTWPRAALDRIGSDRRCSVGKLFAQAASQYLCVYRDRKNRYSRSVGDSVAIQPVCGRSSSIGADAQNRGADQSCSIVARACSDPSRCRAIPKYYGEFRQALQLGEARFSQQACIDRGRWNTIGDNVVCDVSLVLKDSLPRRELGRRVPERDHAYVRMAGAETEDAPGGGTECQMLGVEHRQSDPAGSQDATELAVREERYVAAESAQMVDESIAACRYRRGQLTERTAVREYIPIGAFSADIDGSEALVSAVIPLDEIRFDNRLRTQTRQLARATRALSRTHQDRSEFDARQAHTQFARLSFAVRGQRNIRGAGMLPGKRPLRFTVTNKIEREHHALSLGAGTHPIVRLSGLNIIVRDLRIRISTVAKVTSGILYNVSKCDVELFSTTDDTERF